MGGHAVDAADHAEDVRALLSEARAGLQGVEDGALEAELLLAHVLGLTRSDLRLRDRVAVRAGQRERLEQLLRRRSQGEPLSYVMGHGDFFGRTFELGPGVLIPRPETEGLVEEVLARRPVGRVADVGTGSGAIALTLALELPDLRQILALDRSFEALAQARRNHRQLAPDRPVTFLLGDLLAPLAAAVRLDLVASNLPYVEPRDLGVLSREVRDHEPSMALVPVGESVDHIRRRLMAQAWAHLRPGGSLVLEVGAGQAGRARDDFLAAGWRQVVIRNDLAGIGRVVAAERP